MSLVAWVMQLVGDVRQNSQGNIVVMRSGVEEYFVLFLFQTLRYFGRYALNHLVDSILGESGDLLAVGVCL